MTSSDWIAIASTLIALSAFVVGGLSLRLQKASAEGDAQEQLDKVISTLTQLLGRLNEQSSAPSAPSGPVSYVAVQGTMSELRAVGSQGDDLVHPDHPSDSDPTLSWYGAYVLANTFGQVWDNEKAGTYWELAVRYSTDEPQAHFVALQGRAWHRYSRDNEGDVGLARKDFDEALRLLDPSAQGADATLEQTVGLYLSRANLEQLVGNTSEMVEYLWKAWVADQQIRAFWRRSRAERSICTFVFQNGGTERFLDPTRPAADCDGLAQVMNAWEMAMREQQPRREGSVPPAGADQKRPEGI